MPSPRALTADHTIAQPHNTTEGSPARAANTARNAQGTWLRAARWRPARATLWHLLDRRIQAGDRVAVVGAGNGDTVPMRQLGQRAGHVDLIDLDATALKRARRRLIRRRNVLNMIVEDVTFGSADAIAHATVRDAAPPPDRSRSDITNAYDVVIADLLFTQLLYPALSDADLSGPVIDHALQTHGQPLTNAVVAWLHTSAPHGLVVHVHDILGWWPGHPQPFTIDDVLVLADHDPAAALDLARTGNVPYGCDPRQACAAIDATIIDTALWRWPFATHVDYLVCATVAQTACRSVPADSERSGAPTSATRLG